MVYTLITKDKYIAEIVREEVLDECRVECRVEGRVEGVKMVASRMLLNQMPIDEIVHFTGLSEQEVQSLQEKPQE
jgi:predicted transposase/invertase (TIGR01784 family)